MTIKLVLSAQGVRDAISKLNDVKDNIEFGAEHAVGILAMNGAAIANLHYGSMAKAVRRMEDDHTAVISVGGDAPLIAEFGAGDATIPGTGFENQPDTPVFRGSYSLLVGSKQYWKHGYWEFPPGSGHYMIEVLPKRGLFEAKEYIVESGNSVAKEVIRL